MPRKWLAAGYNVLHQLSKVDGNVTQFTSIDEDTEDILISTWCSLVVLRPGKVVSQGGDRWTQELEDETVLKSVIGKEHGFSAALDDTGLLYLYTDRAFVLANTADSPSLAFLAMSAGRGSVTCILSQPEDDHLAHVSEFADFEAFTAWHRNPSDPANPPKAQYVIPGRPKQLVAGTISFAILMEDNSVYNWGDPRFRHLGRSVKGPDATPANEPGLIDALSGLNICKIALGGLMSAAVSEDGAAYFWGASRPGMPTIDSLKPKDDEMVVLVELNVEDEPDIVDISVGTTHAALVTAAGEVFAIGQNQFGQLGIPEVSFAPKWTRVPGVDHVTRVYCRAQSTLIMQET